MILPSLFSGDTLLGSDRFVSLVPGFEPGPVEIVLDAFPNNLPLLELDRSRQLLAFEFSPKFRLLHLVLLPPQVGLGPLAFLSGKEGQF